MYVALKYNTEI